ncbi:MAG: DUF4838 domain-containing protein, partial [Planctomycetota bacterium]
MQEKKRSSLLLYQLDPPKDIKKTGEEAVKYLELIAGVKPAVKAYTPAMQGKKGILFLGRAAVESGGISEAEYSACAADGFRIKMSDGNIYIAGGKYWGTYYGLFRFFEKLGARFYSIDHEVIPKVSKVKITELDIFDKPVFAWRNIKKTNMKLGQQLQLYHSMRPMELDKKIGYLHWLHSSLYLVPYHKYGKSNPEYYAEQYRDRMDTDYVKEIVRGNKLHLCFSNPDVQRIAEERLIYAIEKQSDVRIFAISQSDGWGWCNCKNCKALDPAGSKS